MSASCSTSYCTAVIADLVHCHLQRRGMTLHNHAQRIPYQKQVNAAVIQQPSHGEVVCWHHGNGCPPLTRSYLWNGYLARTRSGFACLSTAITLSTVHVASGSRPQLRSTPTKRLGPSSERGKTHCTTPERISANP